MQIYAVHTQMLENYNLEADNELECHWKYKSGETYLVHAPREQDALAAVYLYTSSINNNNCCREYPINCELYNQWVDPENFVDEDHKAFEIDRAIRLDRETMKPILGDLVVKHH